MALKALALCIVSIVSVCAVGSKHAARAIVLQVVPGFACDACLRRSYWACEAVFRARIARFARNIREVPVRARVQAGCFFLEVELVCVASQALSVISSKAALTVRVASRACVVERIGEEACAALHSRYAREVFQVRSVTTLRALKGCACDFCLTRDAPLAGRAELI